MFEKLSLTNFTAFTQLDLDFVPGINVLVGGNATGKTHIMKVLYGLMKHGDGPGLMPVVPVFGADSFRSLIRLRPEVSEAQARAQWGDRSLWMIIPSDADILGQDHDWPTGLSAVFVPPTDMLSHTRGFASLYDLRDIDFDSTQAVIVKMAMLPPLRTPPPAFADLLDEMQRLLGGPVVQEGERFYIETPNGRIEMPIVAEGLRKLALLWLLIRNGSLEPGTVLFWDEPEANLNPSLLEVVARVLHRLAETGVQIFIATHSYLVLQEMELARKPETPYQYICLERKDGEISATTAKTYLDITPNLIEEEYLSVHQRRFESRLAQTREKATT